MGVSLPDCTVAMVKLSGSMPGGSTEDERESLYQTVAMVKLSGSMPGGSTEDERECLYLTVAMVKLSGSMPGGSTEDERECLWQEETGPELSRHMKIASVNSSFCVNSLLTNLSQRRSPSSCQIRTRGSA